MLRAKFLPLESRLMRPMVSVAREYLPFVMSVEQQQQMTEMRDPVDETIAREVSVRVY